MLAHVSICVFFQVLSNPPRCPHQGQTLQNKMNIIWVFQSLSLCCLSLGGSPALSHSPSSPFTHHEEKIQNMWCTSLSPQLPEPPPLLQLHVYCRPSNTNMWQWHQKKTSLIPPASSEKIFLENIAADIYNKWQKQMPHQREHPLHVNSPYLLRITSLIFDVI